MKLDFWKSIVLVCVIASVVCLGVIAYGILMVHNDLENLSCGWNAIDVNVTDMPDLNTSVDFGYGESIDVNVMDMPSVEFGYGESLDVDVSGSVYNW